MLTPIVEPSGGALAIASVPRLPLAPALLSITIGWPVRLASLSPTMRAMMSGVEPGPYGTMIRTGPLGQSLAAAVCAAATLHAAIRASAVAARRNGKRVGRCIRGISFEVTILAAFSRFSGPRP